MKYFILPLLFILSNAAYSVDNSHGKANQRQIKVDVTIERNFLPSDPENWTLYVYAARPGT